MKLEIDDLKFLLRVLAFAARKHSSQRRKGVEASPYINHPIAVAGILCDEGGVDDLEVISSAILHDTVEDTDTTLDELEAEFGRAIRDIVAEVTDDKSLPKPERKRRQVEKAPTLSDKAKVVKLADKIANLRDVAQAPPADWDLARRQEYFDWAKRVVDGMRGVHPVLEKKSDSALALRPAG